MVTGEPIKLIECPRDAMQGLNYFIPTRDKISYLNLLLKVGFTTLDFGSFVSPKMIPQMADTAEVLDGLDLNDTNTKLLAIVANLRGAEEALKHSAISCVGYPFSISETFQKRNTNADIASSLIMVEKLLDICHQHRREAVIYLSMAFGNPYGDTWNEDIVQLWCDKLVRAGVTTVALSDTTGVSTAESVASIFKSVSTTFQEVEFGVHLHSTPATWEEKIEAAYLNGCRRFDSALKGYGGCPMAADALTGNIATENLLEYFSSHGEELKIDRPGFNAAMEFAGSLFH